VSADRYVEALDTTWRRRPGLLAFLLDANHKSIGTRYIVTALAFMVLGGLDSLVIRTQLALPDASVVDPRTFNQLFTTHGSAMMYLFAVPIVEGLATYLVPLMVGARDMPFPRLNVFGYYLYLGGGSLLYAPTLADIGNFLLPGRPLPRWIPETGWFAYPPLSGAEYSPGPAQDIWLIALTLAEVAAILAAIELLVVILKCRAPGMSLARMPLFVWSVLGMAIAILIAFPSLVVGSVLLEAQRMFDLPFFDPQRGGDPILWQHLFWIFGHPEVYIMFLPATGVVSTVLPIFTRRPIVGYTLIVFAVLATAVLSVGLWVHHMFAVGLPWLPLTLFSASSMLIAIPSGVQVFAWLATLLRGRRIELTTPMLFSIGFLVTFVLGGLTGVMVASVPFDLQVHDTYFVVAHFHYVLVGGVVFPVFAAIYLWFPKVTGRMLDERLGRLAFLLQFVGMNAAFLPQHGLGLLGMPRRVYTYADEPDLVWMSLTSTIGTYVMAAGVLVIGLDIILARRRPAASADPWSGHTLEWAVASPPRPYGFATVPLVRGRDPLLGPGQLSWGPQPPPSAVTAPGGLRRETLGTDPVRARPTDLVLTPGPSVLPAAAAMAFIALGLSMLARLYPVSIAAAVAGVALLVAWMWPRPEDRAMAAAGRTIAGFEVPRHASGPTATAWWGLGAGLLTTGVGFLGLMLSAVYLIAREPGWPPDGVALPGPEVPVLALAATALAALAARLALRDARAGRPGRTVARALGATVVMGGIAIAGHASLVLDAPDPTSHAQAAIRVVVALAQALVLGGGVLAAAVVAVQARLGYFDPVRHQAVDHVRIAWSFLAMTGLATSALLIRMSLA
jgi:cytochrome c oxidase subunit I+III